MWQTLLHLNSFGPLPGMLAGVIWHGNTLIELTAFGVVVWILHTEQRQ
jgi:hypothetical protein